MDDTTHSFQPKPVVSVNQPSSETPGRGPAPTSEPSLADLVEVIRRNRRLVVRLPLAIALTVVAVLLLLPRRYESAASFMPQNVDPKNARIAGLAAQFGVMLPSGDAGQSLGFYVELVRSRTLLRSLVESRYTFQVDGEERSGTLMDFFNVAGRTEPLRREAALKKLKRAMQANADATAGVVKIAVRTRWAPLSQQVAQRALDLVSDFNLRRRQSQASAERAFVGGRVSEAKAELDSAGTRLRVFLERNRDYRHSPLLTYEFERLSRDLHTRQQLFESLAQAFDQARIDEVRDTPVITVVDPPDVAAKPLPLNLLLSAVLALTIGTVVAISLAFAREMLPRK